MNRPLTLSRLGILLSVTATVLITISTEPCQARQTQSSGSNKRGSDPVSDPVPPSGTNTDKKSSGGGAIAAISVSLGAAVAASAVRRKRERERAGKSN